VVGDHDNECTIERVDSAQLIEELPEHRIGVRDFSVVRRAAGSIFGRRFVRRVRIEEVNPGEPGGRRSRKAGRQNPFAGGLDHVCRSALGESKCRAACRRWKTVVVLVEAAAQSEPTLEDERADESARSVPSAFEHRGERRDILREAERDVVANAVMARRQTSQNRGVRRQRHRDMRERLHVLDTVASESIEVRCQTGGTPVRAQAIATERVDGHEKNIRAVELT